ncbi:MAG: purine-binding chemotaxis protein CheW [Deltaproteobacteria bacterium]|nr:purine-binding chemotaxis protein CheW [Deltaproteobacteria bacterium]
MLYLQFKIGGERYIIEAKDVMEIVPFAHLKKVPGAPGYVAGLLNYRGSSIPVIDVCHLMSGKGCEVKLGSRIALVNYLKDGGKKACIGLLIEHMTETVSLRESDFKASGVNLKDHAYLGGVVMDDAAIVQRLNVDKILPDEAGDMLFEDAPSRESA